MDFVITTCTLFNPMPSMSSMIMNRFGMRSDCQNYSCAGMGCAGGVAMVALARDLLTVCASPCSHSLTPKSQLASLASALSLSLALGAMEYWSRAFPHSPGGRVAGESIK